MGNLQKRSEELKQLIDDAGLEHVLSELPPSLIPKARVCLASLGEAIASTELLLGEGWVGSPSQRVQEAKQVVDEGDAIVEKINAMIGWVQNLGA